MIIPHGRLVSSYVLRAMACCQRCFNQILRDAKDEPIKKLSRQETPKQRGVGGGAGG